jgi:hypothetical protein
VTPGYGTQATPQSSLLDDRYLRLLQAARTYRIEVLPNGDDDEREAADELDAAIAAFDAYCPKHRGFDPDQRGPGWCPYCVAGIDHG